jgi:hypothetical protein
MILHWGMIIVGDLQIEEGSTITSVAHPNRRMPAQVFKLSSWSGSEQKHKIKERNPKP